MTQRIKLIARIGKPVPYQEYLTLESDLRRRREELILVCEHSPVITAGVQFKDKSIRVPETELAARGVAFHKTSRGGDVTAHEPGQIVIYVHVDLKARSLDVSRFFKGLLKSAQAAAKNSFGLDLDLDADAPGLYVGGRKIASIGIQFKSFFTGHGLAINVANDLSTFSLIDPCGFDALEMTSVQKEGGRPDKTGLFIDLFYEHLHMDHLPERG